jgi:hypothetical protein
VGSDQENVGSKLSETHDHSMLSENGCSSNYAIGVRSGEAYCRAEIAYRHEHPPLKRGMFSSKEVSLMDFIETSGGV